MAVRWARCPSSPLPPPALLNFSGTAAPPSSVTGSRCEGGLCLPPCPAPHCPLPGVKAKGGPRRCWMTGQTLQGPETGADLPGDPQASRVSSHPEPSWEAGHLGSSTSMTLLATPTRPPRPDICPFVLQSELDLEKGSEMRKWVLSGILASEETYLSHLEALLLVRGAGLGGQGRPGQCCHGGLGAAPTCPQNPCQHPQEGRTWPCCGGWPSPGGQWTHS